MKRRTTTASDHAPWDEGTAASRPVVVTMDRKAFERATRPDGPEWLIEGLDENGDPVTEVVRESPLSRLFAGIALLRRGAR